MNETEARAEIREASHKAMIRHLDGTPNDDLRELIERWRENAGQYGLHETDTFNARCETWETAAKQLEQALEDAELGE